MSARLHDSWLVWGATARGASHIRSGMRNQDAIGFLPASDGSPRCALVASDGHGGKAHPLSHLGSRFAVEAALAVLGDLLASDGPDPCDTTPEQRAALVERIHQTWIGRVTAHAGRDGELQDILLPYGATLVAAAVSEGHILLLQIGDGDVLLAGPEGGPFKPLADDEGLFGEQTYSLCRADAPDAARTASVGRGRGTLFVMVSTDGLAKSFSADAEFQAVGRRYRDLIAERGLGGAVEGLGTWLSEVTAQGSGDDISLGFLVSAGLHRGAVAAAARSRPAAHNSVAHSLGWLVLGAALTLGAAIGNPWRPWSPFAAPDAAVVHGADPGTKPGGPAPPLSKPPKTSTLPAQEPMVARQPTPQLQTEDQGND
jgi:Protein phosphatase 2C